MADESPSITCFICLEAIEEGKEEEGVFIPSNQCNCRFKVHQMCWNEWMEGKTEYDCPICRKKSLRLPQGDLPLGHLPQGHLPQGQEQEEIVIIVDERILVQNAIQTVIEIQEEELDRQQQVKCLCFGCLIIPLIFIIITSVKQLNITM